MMSMADERRDPARGRSSRDARARSSSSERTCVGCGKRAAREDLVRLVLSPREGAAATVVVDAKDGAFGRGAHVHPSPRCVAQCERGLARNFKQAVEVDAIDLGRSIASAFSRRLEGLLSGGMRAGHVAVGGDSVEESLREGRAKLVLLAADAVDAKKRAPSDALVWGDKLRLARALGRKPGDEGAGVGVCSITNVALATAVRRAWLCAAGLANTSGHADDAARVRSRRAESAGGNE